MLVLGAASILRSTATKVSVAFVIGTAAGGVAAWVVASKFGEARLLAVQLRHEKEASALAEEALRQSERVLEFERTQREMVSEIEGRYEREKARLTKKEAVDARALVARLGGLRDPGKAKAATTGMPRGDCPTLPAGGGGAPDARLSGAASEFLLGEAERADRDANLARSCLLWAREVKRQQEAMKTKVDR